jgi:hypothetical protein
VDYAKGADTSPFSILTLQQLEKARKNAARALAEAKDVGDLNPSTRVHELIAYIGSLSEPAPIEGAAPPE